MERITQTTLLPQGQAAQFAEAELETFLEPLLRIWPDKRLRATAKALVQGLLVAQSPHVTKAMHATARTSAWAAAKRGYRLLHSSRVTTHQLTKTLYGLARRLVEEEQPQVLIVAIDPVQFEKPYTRRLEGVSRVYKSRPPDARGKARLTWGYPAITATIVNLQRPACTYARWFSYQSPDFVSQNRHLRRAIRTTRALFPQHPICFVLDGAGDDQKMFRWVREGKADFIVTVAHPERVVEVWNERLARWERTAIGELMQLVLWQGTFEAYFRRAGRWEKRTLRLGWFRLRLPEDPEPLSLVVVENLSAEEEDEERLLGLLTSRPVTNIRQAQRVYADWRLRGRIEHGYRLDQEAGLNIEQLLVRSLDAMQRLFVFVLWATQFLFHALARWPRPIVLWFQRLGGKLGRKDDRSGLYWLLWGLATVWQALAVWASLGLQPALGPPQPTYG